MRFFLIVREKERHKNTRRIKVKPSAQSLAQYFHRQFRSSTTCIATDRAHAENKLTHLPFSKIAAISRRTTKEDKQCTRNRGNDLHTVPAHLSTCMTLQASAVQCGSMRSNASRFPALYNRVVQVAVSTGN